MEIFRLVFSPIAVNTYIVADPSGDCAVIDCGCYDTDEFRQLTDLIDDKGLRPVLLLNTHCHLDHIFGNRFMLEKYNLSTLYNSDDEYNRLDSVHHAMIFGLSMETPPPPAGYLSDGQEIKFGETTLKVLFVPGHSAGGVAFYNLAGKSVFTGDTLFRDSIGRTDLPGGNYEKIMHSIRTRLLVLPPETAVYAGHGEPTTIGQEIRHNPYLQEN